MHRGEATSRLKHLARLGFSVFGALVATSGAFFLYLSFHASMEGGSCGAISSVWTTRLSLVAVLGGTVLSGWCGRKTATGRLVLVTVLMCFCWLVLLATLFLVSDIGIRLFCE